MSLFFRRHTLLRLTAGVETTFRESDDFSFVFNLLIQFPIETEVLSHTLVVYLPRKYSLLDGEGEAMVNFPYDLAGRFTTTVSALLPFAEGGAEFLKLLPLVKFTVKGYVSLNVTGIFMRTFREGENVYGVSAVFF